MLFLYTVVSGVFQRQFPDGPLIRPVFCALKFELSHKTALTVRMREGNGKEIVNKTGAKKMHIPDELMPDLNNTTRPILIYRNEDGIPKFCYVLRKNEFVASFEDIKELCRKAGLWIVDRHGNRL